MTVTRKPKSDAFAAIHGAVAGMNRARTVDQETMRAFDEACLTPPRIGEGIRVDRFQKQAKAKAKPRAEADSLRE